MDEVAIALVRVTVENEAPEHPPSSRPHFPPDMNLDGCRHPTLLHATRLYGNRAEAPIAGTALVRAFAQNDGFI
jgi:hypothetical protein